MLLDCVAPTNSARCRVCNHIYFQSSDTSSKRFVANCASGNGRDQCAASVTAICHDTISQRHISLQLSDSGFVCHRAAG